MLCPTAALPPKGEMLFSERFWGGSVTRWVFLGHIGILHAKAGFPATCVVDTCMPPVSQPETSCRSFPCVMTSGQCLLTISHMFPTGCSSTPILTTQVLHGSQFSFYCASFFFKDCCLFLYPRISFIAPALVISLMLPFSQNVLIS